MVDDVEENLPMHHGLQFPYIEQNVFRILRGN
jgi:hypothetical protein